MSEKSVTLKHIGYYCDGTAFLNLWGGGQGNIQMNAWSTQKGDRKSIVKGINDGQFGCESIESAKVDVYDLYENGYKVYDNTIEFSAEEIKDAQRGI
jgi:hypothetical protein